MYDLNSLRSLAKNIRKDILSMTYHSGVNGGHIGGALSSADILAALYGEVLKVSPETVLDDNRDRFILSKGHTAIGHYAALAECGFIARADLDTFEQSETKFSTHEIMNLEKGIEISGGSLGYGLSVAVGIALNAKRIGKDYKTYVLIGDGEMNEGTIWEAAMAAAKFKLSNLISVVDVNGQSLDGYISNIMPVDDIEKVWEGFGWNVAKVDGNSIEQLLTAFESLSNEKPNAIIAHTIKGKGIPSIEGEVGWHHARITEDEYVKFLNEMEIII